MRPTPEINQLVEAILIMVHIPFDASVLDPVVPVGAQFNVSVVIAIVQLFPLLFMIVTTDPIGNATELFAGIVSV